MEVILPTVTVGRELKMSCADENGLNPPIKSLPHQISKDWIRVWCAEMSVCVAYVFSSWVTLFCNKFLAEIPSRTVEFSAETVFWRAVRLACRVAMSFESG